MYQSRSGMNPVLWIKGLGYFGYPRIDPVLSRAIQLSAPFADISLQVKTHLGNPNMISLSMNCFKLFTGASSFLEEKHT